MKSVWTIVSVFAVANLLALAGFVGWLKMTDRLDRSRVHKLREIIGKTLSDERAEEAAAAQKAEEEKKKADEAEKAARLPMSAAERLATRVEVTEIDLQRSERLRREIADLQHALDEERTRLAAERDRFETGRKAYEAATQRQREIARDEQFQKTLGVIAALKPPEAVKVLRSIMDGSAAPPSALPVNPAPAANTPVATPVASAAAKGMEAVVEYLNAMDDRPRGKIIAEIVKTVPALAGDLLERLRLRGQLPGSAKDASR